VKLPIENKDRVLETLRQNLHICEVVVQHSIMSNEPPECQIRGNARSADLREAIRFIEEHGA
jgi:hypothetical protein